MRHLIAAAVASAAVSSPALAQSFDGAYMWVGAGGVDAEAEIQERAPSAPENPIPSVSVGDQAGAYAIGLGFGREFGDGYYVGVEIDAGQSETSFTHQLNAGALTIETRDQFGVALRGGFVVREGSMFYGLVGWSQTSVDARASGGQSKSENLGGIRVGVGYEHALSSGLGLRAEIAHVATDETSLATAPPAADAAEYSIASTQLRLAAVLRF